MRYPPKTPDTMKHTILLLLTFVAFAAGAQNLSLTFTSVTDAKFFVYINGTLQNQRSSGMVTVNDLEEKNYHVRIVIDDPFEIAVTRTIKPDAKHNEYTVQFNAVRERVYLKQAANSSKSKDEDNNLWIPQDPVPPDTISTTPTTPQRTSIRRIGTTDTATRKNTHHIRTQSLDI